MKFVVLLRGVNLGRTNRVKMSELRAALDEAGFGEARTLLQSGNVVLAHESGGSDVDAAVRDVLAERFGLDVDVVVRDEHAVRAIVADNPLGEVATDGSRQFVVFCSEPPDPERLPEAVAPERLVTRATELHAWCPDGMRDSRLMKELGRRPPARVTTFRNWNTVEKLGALLEE